MSNSGKEIGGEAFHVGDCHVWSAIYYLDSLTDYRECLPQLGVCPRPLSDELVMLDSAKNLPSPRVGLRSSSAVVKIVMLIFLIDALLLYFARHV